MTLSPPLIVTLLMGLLLLLAASFSVSLWLLRKQSTEMATLMKETVQTLATAQQETLISLRAATNLVATQDPMVFGNLQAMTPMPGGESASDPYPKSGDELYVDDLREKGVTDESADFDRAEFGSF